MASSASPSPADPWRTELTDLIRAACGGLLFGVPLLYTMEVWWLGAQTGTMPVLVIVAVLAVPLLVMNKTEGFRGTRDTLWRDAAADTVEAIALALVLAALMLLLIREITPDTPVHSALGKILYESVPFCLGIGFARHLLSGGRSSTEGEDEGDSPGADRRAGEQGAAAGERGVNPTVADLGATLVGAVFVSLTIAPTDEVPLIASAMTPLWLLVVMAASLLISYAIVFVAGFSNQDRRHTHEGVLQHPITETVACYLLALLSALILIWLFQRDLAPWPDLLARVVILGLPAAIGGAAGRLAI